MSSVEGLKFGTSGLRGLVVELLGWPAYGHALAFANYARDRRMVTDGGAVLVGRDLRASSPQMAQACLAAIQHAGLTAVDCGALPTPALALAAMQRRVPAIMVTGSHIPEDRNGLKFYRPDGEITKGDEAGILLAFASLAETDVPSPSAAPVDQGPVEVYRRRYADFFGTALAGMRVGVYQHSSVSRDILVEILNAAGAETVALGRADRFIPVDTEALREEDVRLAAQWASEHPLDAIVSTDGDADRPLVADEAGSFIRGDLVGLITARLVGADAIVTPVTSNSALERSGIAVVRTRVGSPYVIAAMDEQRAAGKHCVVGFEANGGVLLGSDVMREGRRLPALPTRDAVLPILATLAAAREAGTTLSSLVKGLKAGAIAGHRLQSIPASVSGPFLARLDGDADYAAAFFDPVGKIASTNRIDGPRFTLANGEMVHFRASGNAPELRCYAEATTQARAEKLLHWGLKAAARAMGV